MLILSIESSCDETSLALLEGTIDPKLGFYKQVNQFKIVNSLISSQIDIHKQYGGVIPEIGARSHAEQIHILLKDLLSKVVDPQSNSFYLSQNEINYLSKLDYIFVTTEPGLVSALRVGREFAKTLQFFIHQLSGNFVEISSVNHLRGHIISSLYNMGEVVDDINIFPHLHLLVSGGNTQLILLRSPDDAEIIGQTLDDASGECFDKIGRMLGFSYPGGVWLAKTAGLEKYNKFDLPISMKGKPSFNFSYSGLKTACKYILQDPEIADFKFEERLSDLEVSDLVSNNIDNNTKLSFIRDFSISAQAVIVQQLVNQTKRAIKKYNPTTIGVSGGVSANSLLRKELGMVCGNLKLFKPHISLTGDNAVMIGLAGVSKLF